MKALILTALTVLAMVGFTHAGGIEGRVVDSNGNPRSDVKISVKGYRQTTTTDSNGNYVLKMPESADGVRVNVYADGIFATNTLVPKGNANCTVMIKLVRR